MTEFQLTLHSILCHTVWQLTPTSGWGRIHLAFRMPIVGVDATAVGPCEWAARAAGEMAMTNTRSTHVMINSLSPASLAARSAAIMGALAACLFNPPGNYRLDTHQ